MLPTDFDLAILESNNDTYTHHEYLNKNKFIYLCLYCTRRPTRCAFFDENKYITTGYEYRKDLQFSANFQRWIYLIWLTFYVHHGKFT